METLELANSSSGYLLNYTNSASSKVQHRILTVEPLEMGRPFKEKKVQGKEVQGKEVQGKDTEHT